MRFRLGLFVGFLIGYVLGAKAGRQRYEQILSWSRQVMNSEPARQIQAEMRNAANQAGGALEQKANEGVGKVTSMARDQSGGDI